MFDGQRPPLQAGTLCRFHTALIVAASRCPINSNRKLFAHVERHAHWSAGLRIDRTPESPSLGQQLAIAFPQNFREPFECKPGRFSDPRAQHDVIAQTGRGFVIDFVPQHHPSDAVLCFATGDRLPMGGSNFLDPSQVHSVVNVILLVDVSGHH